MTDDHKAALAAGREESQGIRRYLEALAAERTAGPTSAPRTLTTVANRLGVVQGRLASRMVAPLQAVKLEQEAIDLKAEVRSLQRRENRGLSSSRWEAAFVKHAPAYSAKHGLTRAAWRKVGVPVDILDRAGIR